jgi:hypothetical protein
LPFHFCFTEASNPTPPKLFSSSRHPISSSVLLRISLSSHDNFKCCAKKQSDSE